MALSRYRNKNSELSRLLGNIRISTLRSHYGDGFAPDCSERDKLGDVLQRIDDASLLTIVIDMQKGKLP